MSMEKTVLITGAAGMIGSETVKGMLAAGYRVIGIDRRESTQEANGYVHYAMDLSDAYALAQLFAKYDFSRVIHLAALAHSVDGKEFTWEEYYRLNVECAHNIFTAAGQTPVLFISTVDVYGFTKGSVTAKTKIRPVSNYAKSKALAEDDCKSLPHFTIFRFSPVYTDAVKRDIQKRYYLKYPQIAYRIGKGMEYEVLNIKNAVEAMVNWCSEEPKNDIRIIKDPMPMNTANYIAEEKRQGRASVVLCFPRRIVALGYKLIKLVTGENKYTYLLNKAVFPLRTE